MATVIASGKISIEGCSVRSQRLPFTRLYSISQRRRLWRCQTTMGFGVC